jgi:hypothetical protein
MLTPFTDGEAEAEYVYRCLCYYRERYSFDIGYRAA